jgi:hypothetical protein
METLRIRFPVPSMVESVVSPTACEPKAGRFAGVGDASNVSDAFWRLANHGNGTALIVDGHAVSLAALRTAAWNVRCYLLSRLLFCSAVVATWR